MKYLSLFSGIEAATQAWHPLGWEPVAFSEIENFPNAVLEHHYPDVPNLGDVTKITENRIKKLGHIDLVVFGSPCQDLSVAGKRKGLDGERSGLFTNAIKIIKWARKHCGCRYALWENVPGAFSSNGGEDFKEVLRLFSGATFPLQKWRNAGVVLSDQCKVEWRTLDAQFFGVPQRRRRIFALADFGNWESREPILFERESVFGDFAESGEARKETPTDARGCLASGSDTPRVAGTLDTECGGGKLTHQSVANGHIITHPQDSISGTLTARMMSALGARDVEEGAVMPCTVEQPNLSAPLSARDYKGPGTDGINEETTNNMVVYENHPQDTVGALCARDYKGVGNQFVGEGKVIPATKRAEQGGEGGRVALAMQVRRLTPKECERLQGFPDDYTKIPFRKKSAADCPDGARYKALGNSMAVPVMRWIGMRIGG